MILKRLQLALQVLNNIFKSNKADKQDLYDLEEKLSQLIASKADSFIVNELHEQFKALDKTKAAISTSIEDILRQIKEQKLTILSQEKRLMGFLEEAQKSITGPLDTAQIQNMLKEEEHLFDAMFVSFEDMFRGTREIIKNRQAIYLDYLQQVEAGTYDAPVLDIGCGRGEWLELLKERGHAAAGIDTNSVMVQQCREIGLDVIESDALEYLKSRSSDSAGAITGFHIIEHLALKKLIMLFDESLRVLKPGGLVIFETPNPKNMVVGACNFYSDPTHIKPVFPETIKFQLEKRGFERVELKYVNPVEGSPFKDNDEAGKMFDNWFFGARDFAVIGYKA